MHKPNMEEAKKRAGMVTKVIPNACVILKEMKKMGVSLKYFVRTYGCQMNIHDSEHLKGMLEELSYQAASTYEEADLIIINTCAIRENAHQKGFGFLGRVKYLKRRNPNLIVGFCGCMAQEAVVVEKIISDYQWINFVLGTHNIHMLPHVIRECLVTKKLVVKVLSNESNIYEGIPVKYDHPFKAWVNIMYGCDKFCTYCIVPYTRGKQRSRRPCDIIKAVKDLIKAGYMEITLLGQNVNAYQSDGYNFARLLATLSKLDLKRIRFLTSHPWEFTPEMLMVIKNNPNIMPHFHLPVQAGSDRILKLMKRRYTYDSYLELVKMIKRELPHASITTDIIVGFPGETTVDFNQTLKLVKAVQFDSAFTFIYSKREGTKAALMEDKVSLNIKKERLQALNQVVNHYALVANKKLLNQVVLVLIESINERGLLVGYTETFKLVTVSGNQDLIGKIIPIRIVEAKTWSLHGEIIKT